MATTDPLNMDGQMGCKPKQNSCQVHHEIPPWHLACSLRRLSSVQSSSNHGNKRCVLQAWGDGGVTKFGDIKHAVYASGYRSKITGNRKWMIYKHLQTTKNVFQTTKNDLQTTKHHRFLRCFSPFLERPKGRCLSVPRMKLIINSPTSCQLGPLDRTGGLGW